MAKPTGAITVNNVYYAIWEDVNGGGGQQDLYYIIRGQVQHQDWETNNLSGTLMPFDVHRQIYIANSGDLTEYWFIGDNSTLALASNPVITTTAGTNEIEHSQTKAPKGTKIPNTPEISYVLAKQVVSCTAEDGDVDIHMVGFEAKNDTTFTGQGVEMVKRTADRLFAADYPCSAWHVLCALQQTHRKILYESRPAFAIPVFGNLLTTGGPV